MLLKNLVPPKQCNSTRLVVTLFSLNLIEGKVPAMGERKLSSFHGAPKVVSSILIYSFT